MHKAKWFTLGAAAALFTAGPAVASDGHHHDPAHAHQGAVTVTSDGFVPAKITAKKGEVLNFVVTRKVERTCATELVQKEQGVFAPLPLDKPVRVSLRAPKDGPLEFSCAHGHIAGHIVTH